MQSHPLVGQPCICGRRKLSVCPEQGDRGEAGPQGKGERGETGANGQKVSAAVTVVHTDLLASRSLCNNFQENMALCFKWAPCIIRKQSRKSKNRQEYYSINNLGY